ncbi:hypothetical protein NMD21_23235 [Citrobacter portucalensis]|uniref:hypothetical protein n=1 Tax=Citrobacter portucalensis TaxID=1639133 RepID=UPI001A180799
MLNDLFLDWRNGVLGRLRFFLYFILITVISLFTTWISIINPTNIFALFIFWLGIVLSYYCGFLVITKRYRELIPFPVIIAIIHWGAGLLAFWKGWQWLNLVCAIVFLLLIAVPARRFITDENPG